MPLYKPFPTFFAPFADLAHANRVLLKAYIERKDRRAELLSPIGRINARMQAKWDQTERRFRISRRATFSDLRSGKGGVIDSRQGSMTWAGSGAGLQPGNNDGGLTRPKSRGSRESDPSGGVSRNWG